SWCPQRVACGTRCPAYCCRVKLSVGKRQQGRRPSSCRDCAPRALAPKVQGCLTVKAPAAKPGMRVLRSPKGENAAGRRCPSVSILAGVAEPVRGGPMKLFRLWVLRGPNAWAAVPVLEVGLDLSDWADLRTDRFVQIAERVATWLPGLVLP